MVYTDIKSAMQSWLHDTSAEVVGLIDTFIKLGEARLNRDLHSPKNIKTISGAISATISLPTDFQEIVSLARVDSATTWTNFKPVGMSAIKNGTIGYCLTSTGLMLSPALTGTYELAYYPKLLSIVENSTNIVLSNHPDLYLYVSLLEAAAFTRDEKEQYFYARYQELLDSVNISEAKVGQSTQMRADIYVP